MTVVQPAANAAPSLRVIMAEGKFHGVRIELFKSQYVARVARNKRPHTTPM
jgi:hypothetical protein